MLIFVLVYFLLTATLNNLRGFSEVILGLYVIHKEGASEEEPANIGVVIEGMMLLHHLKSISFGIVVLFVLIYALNLSYSHIWKPKEDTDEFGGQQAIENLNVSVNEECTASPDVSNDWKYIKKNSNLQGWDMNILKDIFYELMTLMLENAPGIPSIFVYL